MGPYNRLIGINSLYKLKYMHDATTNDMGRMIWFIFIIYELEKKTKDICNLSREDSDWKEKKPWKAQILGG